MEVWIQYKAMDFCAGVTDGTHDSPKPKEKGNYLITSKHLQNNSINFSSAYRISEEDYKKIILRSRVDQHDILFSMIGTVGNTVRVTTPIVDFAVKNMAIFKMGGDELKSKWLFYWLQSDIAREYISGRLAGSTQSYLTLDSLRNFPVKAPGVKTMTKIVELLSSIDDKIELNNRINHNLAA
jgi:type I restriction enzyme S subunit